MLFLPVLRVLGSDTIQVEKPSKIKFRVRGKQSGPFQRYFVCLEELPESAEKLVLSIGVAVRETPSFFIVRAFPVDFDVPIVGHDKIIPTSAGVLELQRDWCTKIHRIDLPALKLIHDAWQRRCHTPDCAGISWEPLRTYCRQCVDQQWRTEQRVVERKKRWKEKALQIEFVEDTCHECHKPLDWGDQACWFATDLCTKCAAVDADEEGSFEEEDPLPLEERVDDRTPVKFRAYW